MSKKQTTGKKESIIQNYGLHWREDRVTWKGVKGAPVSLLGIAKNKVDAIVDFREQRGIYALYDNYKLVYVGQTTDVLWKRLHYHRQFDIQGRWDMFSWFGTRYVTQNGLSVRSDFVPRQQKTDVLKVLEALVIAISEPQLNSQSGQWDAVRYYQWWEE